MDFNSNTDVGMVRDAALFFARKQESEMADTALTAKGYDVTAVVGGVTRAIAYLKDTTKPSVVVLEVTVEEDVVESVKRLSQFKHPATKLIIVSNDRGISTYKQVILTGAFEYMTTPLNHDELSAVILSEDGISNNGNKGGVVVWGLVGGIGASTVSANIASYVANQLHRHTLLVDLNLHSGTCGTLLNHHEVGQLASLINYGDDVDGLLLGRSVSQLSDHLSLLNDQLEFNQGVTAVPSSYRSLVESASSEFNTHVWDVGTSAIHVLPEILPHSQTCVLVTELTISGVKALSRSLELLEQYSNVRPIIVVNKVRADSGRILKVDYVEKTIGRKVDHVIEHNGKAFVQCDENGTLIVDSNSNVSREIRKLAGNAVGVASKGASLKQWFGKR